MSLKIITLDNGLRIALERNDNARTCSLGAWVASGSAYETAQTAGVSHFIEHMLFRGTESRTSLDIAEQMDEIGGVINAYTAKELTCFYAATLPEHMTKALDIICDMITHPLFAPEDIELEKGVIKEEIAMYEDSPEDLCADIYYENVWRGSMLGSNILGTVETVDSVTADTLRAHMKRFYVPERTVFSFSGNFDPDAAVEICKNYFGGMENTGFAIENVGAEYRPCITRVKKDFMQNQIILGFKGIPTGDGKRYVSMLLSSILGAASSSRLFQRLREELGLVYSVDCANVSHMAAGLFIICMGLAEKSEEKAIGETLRIIREFPDSVTERELARAKEQTVVGFVMGLESASAVASRNGRNILLFGSVAPEEEIIRRIRAVTLDELCDFARETLDASAVSLCAAGKVHSENQYKKFLNVQGV